MTVSSLRVALLLLLLAAAGGAASVVVLELVVVVAGVGEKGVSRKRASRGDSVLAPAWGPLSRFGGGNELLARADDTRGCESDTSRSPLMSGTLLNDCCLDSCGCDGDGQRVVVGVNAKFSVVAGCSGTGDDDDTNAFTASVLVAKF